MQLDLVVRCKRCGREQSAEYCWDCRLVDPRMCAGGLDSRGMREKRKREYAELRAEREMLMRAAGRTTR
jgi:hypothetical protein